MLINYKLLLNFFFILCMISEPLFSQKFSFVVVADNRNYIDQYRVALKEINDMTVNPDLSFSFPEFLISCGDFDPVKSNMLIYTDKDSFPNLPPFYPVVGNHEYETPDDMDYIMNNMIPNLENIVNKGPQASYSFDYGNIHCIVLDVYSENAEGEVDETLLQWTRDDMNNSSQDNIFVFAHDPAFPRYRHLGDGLNQFSESRNKFWLTLREDPRVRAYFCGHTHYYYRMRISDPATGDAGDFPDQEGGLYQVDVGAIGNFLGDSNLSLVYVEIYEDSVQFRTVVTPREENNWHIADEWVIDNIHRYHVELNEPLADDIISGNQTISWHIDDVLDSTTVSTIYVSNNAGAHWDTLWSAQSIETSFNWDTESFPDGIRYMLRIVVKDENGYGLSFSSGLFTINNPGNASPEIGFIFPEKNELVSGKYNVNWFAGDADGDPLLISLDLSTDNLKTWSSIFEDKENIETYLWNTKLFPNSSSLHLRLRAKDLIVESSDTLSTFELYNEHPVLSDVSFTQISGVGDAIINVHIVDNEEVDPDCQYQINFNDTLYSFTTYNVVNLQTGQKVVQNATQTNGLSEGPYFDGMRLVVKEFEIPEINYDSTYWIKGSTDLEMKIFLPTIDMGSTVLEGIPLPNDYLIEIFDHIVDTSDSEWGVPSIPVKFTLLNLTKNQPANFLILDNDNDNNISRLDQIYIFENNMIDDSYLTWAIEVSGDVEYQAPEIGDKFLIKTRKQLTINDKFIFQPVSSLVKCEDIYVPGTLLLKPNIPNPFNNSTKIHYYLSQNSNIEIKVYNILGQNIKTLVRKHQSEGNYFVQWDGKNYLGLDMSSGIYIVTLSDGKSMKNNKMLMIK